MAEYIKRDSIIGRAHKLAFGRILTDREVEVVEMVANDVPAADVAPVRHGRLIEDGYYGIPCVCSNCGEPCKDAVIGKPWWNYCPYCGAKLDGGAEDAAD